MAAPIGLGAAIYLSEYASPRVRRALKPVLEILAGIPSVVLGYFALTCISPTVVQAACPDNIFNIAAAGIGVGILDHPLIASVAEDAMYAVPRVSAGGVYGLGARKRTTSLRVVFPAAVSGIVAALILGVSRAIGETMVVAIAAGGTGGSLFTLEPVRARPDHDRRHGCAGHRLRSGRRSLAFPSLFFVGFLLFPMTLSLNVVGDASSAGSAAATDGRRDAPSGTSPADAVRKTRRAAAGSAGTIAFEALLLLALLISLGVLVTLLVSVVTDGLPVFADRARLPDLAPVVQPAKAGDRPGHRRVAAAHGVRRRLAFPLGIVRAVYLEEYAPDTRLTRLIDSNIRNLAGVPAIVYGLLGLAIFVRRAGRLTGGRSVHRRLA